MSPDGRASCQYVFRLVYHSGGIHSIASARVESSMMKPSSANDFARPKSVRRGTPGPSTTRFFYTSISNST